MKSIELNENVVNRLVWALAHGAPINIGEHVPDGETFLVVYPGTKSVVMISKAGMMSLDAKKDFISQLRENGMTRGFWPAAFMLHGYLPLHLHVKRVQANGDAIFEMARAG